MKKTDAEWQEILTPEQFQILRKEGTERAGTSPLNDEKRKGIYACAGCGTHLFTSDMKFDSGTGWPSFFDYIEGTLEDSHHGHVFKDGPDPTGLRYCNNGVALTFIPDES